jgi:type III secretory pathway component EscS
MEIIYHIAFGIHLLCVVAILVLLALQANKSPKKLNAGVIHASLTALIAAVVMVGLWDQAHETAANHMKFGVKGLVIAAILTLGYKNVKKSELKNGTWMAMLSLTIFNVVIAYAW